MPIRSFATVPIEELFHGGRTGRRFAWAAVERVVTRKLDMLQYARELLDLASPPGNRLEALGGSWKGFHSIRVNDQFRVVFRWVDGFAEDVDVVDSH